MEGQRDFHHTNYHWQSPAAYTWESAPAFAESSTFRYDLSQVRSYCTPCWDDQAYTSDNCALRMDISPKEAKRGMHSRYRTYDASFMDLSSPHLQAEGSKMDVADELPSRSQMAKRSRKEREDRDPCSLFKDTEEQKMERGLKKIRLPTVEKIAIRVKTLNGHILHLDVDADCLILQLKGEIEAQTGVPANEQRLIYGGASMTDYRSMASYSISSDAVIYMVISLQG